MAEYTLRVTQGTTWDQKIVLKSDDVTPVDITGATVRFQARKSLAHTTAFLSLSVGSGITLSDPTNGELQIVVDEAVTALWPIGANVYGLEIDLGSDTTQLLSGSFIVSAEVVR